MNNIFTQVEHYMREALQQELPEVTTTDLEKKEDKKNIFSKLFKK